MLKWRDFDTEMSPNWFFINTFIFQFLIFWHLKKNCLRISLFWNITMYRQKYRNVGKMTSFWHHDVIELFFLLLHFFSVFDLLLFKKNACQYLYFKMLLYICQNADMSGKWRNYGNMMSVFLFVIFTLLFKKKSMLISLL